MQLVAVALVLGALFLVLWPGSHGGAHPLVGQPVPDYVFDVYGGAEMASSTEGQVTVLNFWASWCPPCREEAPDVDAVSRDFEGRAVFLGVADTGRSVVAADDLGMHFPQSIGGPPAQDVFFVDFLPTTFVITSDGIVSSVFQGPVSRTELAQAVEDAE